ncbi:MAG: DnaD domain protein [Lachnospiraceae bacterium]|nr:DnaD domain protein [Lachnospiraceae bacterium]
MSELTLISDFSLDTTSLSNIYIDEYMSSNNESQIKIYLYLLRNLSKGAPVSVITIADTFNYSVTDVERALFYMEKQGLMGLKMDNGSIVGLRLLPLKKKRSESFRDNLQVENFRLMEAPVSQVKEEKKEFKKPEYSAAQVAEFSARDDIAELLFVVQAYTGKPLTPADIKSIMFLNKDLSFSIDLIDYLVEQCVENGKKSFRYMEKVAITWCENGVTSVEEAKALNSSVPKEVYEVFSAFSIKAGSRKPSVKESGFVKKWMNDFGFDMKVIKKACEITVDKTHSVSFEYADAVLTDWFKKGAKNIKDVEALLNKKNSDNNGANASNSAGKTKAGGFVGRDYDFAQLEKELLSN